MDVRRSKPRKRKARKKSDVTYLSEVFDDPRFASPKNVLELYLDEYLKGQFEGHGVIVATLDVSSEDITVRACGISPKDMIVLAERLKRMALDEYGESDA